MDSGIVVQLFLGILWALGCGLFVTFLLEFREDMFAHPNYHSSPPIQPASNPKEMRVGSARERERTQSSGDGAADRADPVCAGAGSRHGG